MTGIYFDNAATSFPKAPGVAENMSHYILNVGSNVNRGAYDSSYTSAQVLYETRELICSLFKYNKPENVIFTKNVTESLNLIIKGLLHKGDHVIVSSMEHNAVMRPLTSMQKKGVTFTRVSCNLKGELAASHIEKHITAHTKAVIMTHASNVCGTILPLKDVGQICHKHNLFFIIDCAQTAGFLAIDFNELQAHALAFTGHKGLLGPQGIGGFIIDDNLIPHVEPLIQGGTGSRSDEELQPDYMPDKFEAGTPNLPGIFGLNASLKYLLNTGIRAIQEQELYLTDLFLQDIMNIAGINIVGKTDTTNRTALISLDFINEDNAFFAHTLASHYHIMTRCGIHCAPSAHKTLGTFPQGTVRFSFSHFNTAKELKTAVAAVNSCLKGRD